jgi:hypothetical protein
MPGLTQVEPRIKATQPNLTADPPTPEGSGATSYAEKVGQVSNLPAL